MESEEQSTQENWLQLSSIRGPETDIWWRKIQDEEYGKYEAWVKKHTTPNGRKLLPGVSEEDCRARFHEARERIYMRFGYRFAHMLPPEQQRLLRETYPNPPAECLLQAAAGMERRQAAV